MNPLAPASASASAVVGREEEVPATVTGDGTGSKVDLSTFLREGRDWPEWHGTSRAQVRLHSIAWELTDGEEIKIGPGDPTEEGVTQRCLEIATKILQRWRTQRQMMQFSEGLHRHGHVVGVGGEGDTAIRRVDQEAGEQR